MGKRQVKNESALKEIRLPEEGELFGRVLKMMGGENVMIKCDDNITRRGKINKKGHDEFSDEDKDIFYELAKFNQLKIWENTPEVEQNKELKVFLKTFSKNKNNFKN